MTDTDKTYTESSDPSTTAPEAAKPVAEEASAPVETPAVASDRPPRPGLPTASFVVTIIAWICLPLWYPGALVGGIVGVVLSILALRQRRGGWRNLALVSIVASSVLLLVLAVFWSALLITLTQL